MTEDNQYHFEACLEDGEIEDLDLEEDKLQINLDNSPMPQPSQQESPQSHKSGTGLDDFDIEPKCSDDENSFEKIEDFQKRRRIRNERKKKKIVSTITKFFMKFIFVCSSSYVHSLIK